MVELSYTLCREEVRGCHLNTQNYVGENFCAAIGISKTAMSKKMTGKTGFSQKDIIKWCDLLCIDLDQVGEFFYA